MFKFFKGEKQNPFNKNKQPKEHMYWFYESIFERDFSTRDSVEWHSFFDDYGMGKAFMNILSDEDYSKPKDNKKKQIFALWLEYLFSYKLYGEYGSENIDKTTYFKTIP